MPKRRNNPLADFDGQLGRLVFYHFKGKPCVRRAPVREKEFTPPEVKNQSRFRLASQFATAVLTDPVQRARYEQAAQETAGSAQNLAVSDFMLAPTLAEIDLSRYTGRAGEFIKIVAQEGKLGAAEVKVVIADRAKAVVEEGLAAMENDGVSWWYPAKLDLPPDQPLWITVTAADQPGNRTTRSLRHTTGA
jgi:hypothetical protein